MRLMSDGNPRNGVTNVVITRSQDGQFEASATLVLWRRVTLSGFRLMANVGDAISVVWVERQPNGADTIGLPPRSVPWDECQRAILEAYRRPAYSMVL